MNQKKLSGLSSIHICDTICCAHVYVGSPFSYSLAPAHSYTRAPSSPSCTYKKMNGWEDGMYPPGASFPAGYSFGDSNVFGKRSKFGAGDTFGDKNVFGKVYTVTCTLCVCVCAFVVAVVSVKRYHQ